MSEFISVYDLLVGDHKDKCPSLKELATAVEDERVALFFFDRFGRYNQADKTTNREEILDAIASLTERLSIYDVGEVDEFIFHFEIGDLEDLLRRFGWNNELPDFKAIYAKWKAEKGSGEKEDPELSMSVRQNNKAWDVLLGSVMACISRLPASHSKELGRDKTVHELVDDIISKDNKSQQTKPLLSMLHLQGAQLSDTALRDALRAVPEKVLKSFR
ncbi:hypothetical protein N9E93_01730 [Oceanospirillaceae bacterium]|nr:hypothetical protein [Oceanospirillaceae bacterium]